MPGRTSRAGSLRASVYQHLSDGWTDIDAVCDAIERSQPWRHVERAYARRIMDAWHCDQVAIREASTG
jgi:hypothetical protein